MPVKCSHSRFAVGFPQLGGVACQCCPQAVPEQEVPHRVEDGHRPLPGAFHQAADTREHQPADASTAGGMPGQTEQVLLFGVAELQRPGERRAHLRRGRRGPPLLQAHDVADGGTRQHGQLLAPQPFGTPGGVGRQSRHVGGSRSRHTRRMAADSPESLREPMVAAHAEDSLALPLPGRSVSGRGSAVRRRVEGHDHHAELCGSITASDGPGPDRPARASTRLRAVLTARTLVLLAMLHAPRPVRRQPMARRVFQ